MQFMLACQQAAVDNIVFETHFGELESEDGALTCQCFIVERSFSFILKVPTSPEVLSGRLSAYSDPKLAAESMIREARRQMNRTDRPICPVIALFEPLTPLPQMTVIKWPKL